MLKNIVFDMGNVLIKWTPELILDIFSVEGEDREILLSQMFQTKEWVMQDWGMLDEPDMDRIVSARIPERLQKKARECLYEWPNHMVGMPGMKELIAELKAKGYQMYILSNASRALNDYYVNIPGVENISGYVVSASVGIMKPLPEIYLHLLSKFRLKAEECLFIDDLALNCAGAKSVGMDAFHFEGDVQKLREYIQEKEQE